MVNSSSPNELCNLHVLALSVTLGSLNKAEKSREETICSLELKRETAYTVWYIGNLASLMAVLRPQLMVI